MRRGGWQRWLPTGRLGPKGQAAEAEKTEGMAGGKEAWPVRAAEEVRLVAATVKMVVMGSDYRNCENSEGPRRCEGCEN